MRFEKSDHPGIRSTPFSVSMVSESDLDSTTHSRGGQRSRRPILKDCPSRFGVGTVRGLLQSPRITSGATTGGLVRKPNQSQATSIRGTVRSPKSLEDKCLHSELEQVTEHLSLSSAKCHSQSTSKVVQIQGSRGPNRTKATYSPVVSANHQEVLPSPPFTNSDTESGRRDHISLTKAVRSMDRISFLKLTYGKIYPPAVASALIDGFRKSSNKQFEAGWRSFQNWLPPNITEINKAVILDFLVYLRNSGFSHHTALGYRNALKLPLDAGFGINTGDKEFDLLAKSHFLFNPPRPKIIPAWSLDDAMNSLQSKGNIDLLPKEESFMACLFLLAVATGNRTSELAHIDSSTISYRGEHESVSMSVVPSFLYKNQNSKRTPPPIRFPGLPRDPQLCPVSAVKRLQASSKKVSCQKLCVNPNTGSVLNAATLRFWICKSINWLLPETIPRAHDIRKNAFSMAWVRGVPEDEIMKQGFWNSRSVFFRKYFNPTPSSAACSYVAAGSINSG